MTEASADKRSRDRDATERRLLAAAREVIAAEGFQGFGVNAVARRAGCDKQLIYRYYGGADGLLDALGRDLAGWWGERLAPPPDEVPPATYAALIERLALGLLDALREDALVRRLVAWEAAAPGPEVSRLAAARAEGLAAWMREARGDLAPSDGLDAPALNAVLIGAVQHLALSGAGPGTLAGLDLKDEAGWDRAKGALRTLVRGAYGG